MSSLPVVCAVSCAPLVLPAPVLPGTQGPPAPRRWGTALAGWWGACKLHVLWARFTLAPRAQRLDVSALSPHLQRDLNLHDNADGRLQAQNAWQQYERYRDARSWRTPF